MSRDEGLPQTVEEAEAYGWLWLTAECRGCRRKADVELAGLTPAMRLAAVGRRLACRSCGRRDARVSLGASVAIDGGPPLADHRRVAFDGERVVRPVRD